ncbi:AfsR/SARP family transcriptional regulator [Stackebrandtia albiflava]|uniref:AfsR/SARP family transcriptional regulator n=1 Tax=Stackebrandtia albiflava TaxID=406432 RepID=UPI001FCECD71|nr:BTAD domain-containing putative transcriptional regulator [Stackebrandtia albiflava]
MRLLGSVEVFDGRGWRSPGTPKRACVLSALALADGQPVSAQSLMDRVWDGFPPPTGRGVIHGHIAQLRNLLRDEERATLSRADAGCYRLALPRESVDLFAMRHLAAQGKAAVTAGDTADGVALWRRAAALWRGDPLSGVPGSWAEGMRTALSSEYRDLLATMYRVELKRGRHAEVVSELSEVAAAHPLSEPLIAHLMVALYRCDRPGEALARYTALRERLSEELGNEPTDRLRRLHRRMVRQDPSLHHSATAATAATAPAPEHHVPAQLPTPPATFVGREPELAEIVALAAAEPPTGPVLLHGMPGMGKTGLAVHAAHRLAPRFPDGQLFLDLHGYGHACGRVAPPEALRRMLTALGVAAAELPENTEDRAALLRSVLTTRRILLLLDNAAEESQVRPLLPGAGGSMVVVTSRNRLPGLEGVHPIGLDVLSESEARDLLTGQGGRDVRNAEDAATAAEVAEMCGRLPLALRLAAGRLKVNPYWTFSDLRDRLADPAHRLTELSAGDSAVAPAVEASYRDLSAPHRRLLRMLSLLPEGHFGVGAATALVGGERRVTARLLEDLATSHLVTATGPDRYGMHDLIRLYSGQRRERDNPPEVQRAALDRMRAWYLYSARAARGVASRRWTPLPAPPPPADVTPETFDDSRHGRDWLHREQRALATVVAESGGPTAWLIADAMRLTLYVKGDSDTLHDVSVAGLAAADAADLPLPRAAMLFNLAACDAITGRHERNLTRLDEALQYAVKAGSPHWEAQIQTQLGTGHMLRGDSARAIAACETALSLYRQVDPAQIDGTLTVLALVCHRSGRLRQALAYLEESYALARTSGDEHQIIASANLAAVNRELGDYPRAQGYAEAAIRLCRTVGAVVHESHVLDELALIHAAYGRTAEAVATAELGRRLAAESGDRRQQAAALATLAVCRLGTPAFAEDPAREAVAAARAIPATDVEIPALLATADVMLALGAPDDALSHAERALRLAREEGVGVAEGRALTRVARSHAARGEWEAAVAVGREALRNHLRTGHRPGQAETHECLAEALSGMGESTSAEAQHAEAARLRVLMFRSA